MAKVVIAFSRNASNKSGLCAGAIKLTRCEPSFICLTSSRVGAFTLKRISDCQQFF
jgi:hypothetical protein